MGRPTLYTPELAAEICERIALGESLRAICREEDMPGQSTVFRWLDQDTVFQEQYVHARAKQADTFAEEIIEIADDTSRDTRITDNGEQPDTEWIARSRLRVDARKWVMSKLAPKKYGDKIDVTTGNESLNLTPEERANKLQALTALAARRKQEHDDCSDLT